MAWVSTGIYAAFSILGAFSVGLAYLPIAAMLLLLAVLATPPRLRDFLWGVLALVIAALAQAALIFLFIYLL